MAHEIDMSNERANMAFVGEKPWHGLGQQLTADADIDTWKVEAGLNWNIISKQASFEVDGKYVPYPGKTILHRSDTLAPLSIVSDKYNVVQPGEVLEFFRDLTEDLGMKMETAGSLFNGQRFWALANTGEAGVVLGKDEVKGMLLLTSSCDGGSPTVAQFTSVRVVCNNTLSMSLSESGQTRAKVRHRREFKPEDIKASLGLMHTTWNEFMSSITAMSKAKVTDKSALTMIQQILASNEEELLLLPKAKVRKSEEILNIYKNGMGSEMSYGTIWGVLNGVTEYYDHHTNAQSGDAKLWNSWYGDQSKTKDKAFAELIQYI